MSYDSQSRQADAVAYNSTVAVSNETYNTSWVSDRDAKLRAEHSGIRIVKKNTQEERRQEPVHNPDQLALFD